MKRILLYLALLVVASMLPAAVSAQSLTWHSDQLIETNTYTAGNARVAVSGDNAVAVWLQSDGTFSRIYASYSTDSGAAWSTPVILDDNSPLNAADPQVAIDGENVVVVFGKWYEDRFRIFSNYSSDGGATWEGARIIEDNTGNNGYDPQVVISGSNVVAVWRQSDGTRDRIYANHAAFSGGVLTWGTDLIIDSRAYAASRPHLAMSGNNVVAIWSQNDGDKNRIFSRYSSNAGADWNASGDQSLENIDMNQSVPRIAISGNNVVAVWSIWDSSDNVGRIYANRATFSGSSGGTLTWTPANAQRIENNDTLDQDSQQIAISGDHVVAVWVGYDDAGAGTYRVYKAYSTDAGVSWEADSLLQTADVDASSPQVVVSGDNVVALWNQGDTDSRIYARYSSNGGSSWNTPGLIEDNTGHGANSPLVAVSGDNVVAVWIQDDNVYSNYATISAGGLIGPSGDGGGGGGCFIATAAFGTPLAKQVEVLRQFRDRYLLTNAPGRNFVAWYYRNGPVAAKFIENRPLARLAVQAGLYPLIGFSFLLINGLLPFVLAGLLLAALLFFRFRPNKVNAG